MGHFLRAALRVRGPLGIGVADSLLWLLDTAWGVSKLLVVRAVVYDGHPPLPALKASVHAVKKTWGEAAVREFGFGAVFNAALYHYATRGETGLGFDVRVLQSSARGSLST